MRIHVVACCPTRTKFGTRMQFHLEWVVTSSSRRNGFIWEWTYANNVCLDTPGGIWGGGFRGQHFPTNLGTGYFSHSHMCPSNWHHKSHTMYSACSQYVSYDCPMKPHHKSPFLTARSFVYVDLAICRTLVCRPRDV